MLGELYAVQKLYGDKGDGLRARDAFFQELLAPYDFARIRWAFMEYIRQNADMPAPADILRLIKTQRWGVTVL